MEKPEEFNAILEEWLDNLDIKLLEIELAEAKQQIKRLKSQIKEAKKAKKRKAD